MLHRPGYPISPRGCELHLVPMTFGNATSCLCGTLVVLFQSIAYGQTTAVELAPRLAQGPSDAETAAIGRCRLRTSLVAGSVMLGTLYLLDKAWYTQYDRSAFHTFDDSGEWMQMDKAGHLFSAYTLGRWGHAAWRHCGTSEREAVLVGGSLGFLFLTGVELLDGTSSGWGFSWSDMAANATGTAIFMGQEALWKEQRFTVKFSAHLTPYAAQDPDLLGEGIGERILKDYNGQTIWLSGNLRSFTKGVFPTWLNVAFGYGAEGMTMAFPSDQNSGPDELYRQYFLSPDIDLTRIKSRSAVVRTVLFVLNGIKVPMPALEFRSNGRVLAHGLYF